jgi:hypothetical protein
VIFDFTADLVRTINQLLTINNLKTFIESLNIAQIIYSFYFFGNLSQLLLRHSTDPLLTFYLKVSLQ